MKKDVHLTACWFMNNDNVSEIEVKYYNSNNEIIGYVDTDAKGNMKWEIINLDYKEYFYSILCYLSSTDINNKISFESKDENGLRWTKLRIYLAINKVPIAYSKESNDIYYNNSEGRSR